MLNRPVETCLQRATFASAKQQNSKTAKQQNSKKAMS
jgi:hypothetical protein